jgi:hydrogenase maturation protease
MSGGDRPVVLVIGIGNPDRGDDGFGPAVARRLRGSVLFGVRILERSGDALALIEDWNGFSSVVLVDVVTPITEPGRVYRLDLTGSSLPIGVAPRSTHSFGVAEVVELARSLGRLPRYLAMYLVEGERFETGAPLSPAVAKAVVEVAELIVVELSAVLETRQA